MASRVCPWWAGYLLASPVRRLYQDPRAILAPLIRAGTTVLEPGPGMGFFTLELARLVGAKGRVVAVDVQPRMLEELRRRARRAGLAERIEARAPVGERLGVDDLAGKVDFVLAFAVVHELPSAEGFFGEAYRALQPGGRMLLAEPRGHVTPEAFARTLSLAAAAGFAPTAHPPIRGSRTALLAKGESAAA